VLRLIPVLLVAAAIVPAASAGSSRSRDAMPDLWSGIWPAQLMDTGQALGTVTWRQVGEEQGRASIGQPFGGQPFTGCDAGPALFFRGSYDIGGDLIGCTVGADARTLVGRFNGREDFRSGSFVIRIAPDNPNEFEGVYYEDDGVTLVWCGELRSRLGVPLAAPGAAARALSGKLDT